MSVSLLAGGQINWDSGSNQSVRFVCSITSMTVVVRETVVMTESLESTGDTAHG